MRRRKRTVEQDARSLVDGPRSAAYGAPPDSMRRIALAWSAVLDRPVTAREVALCMAALKICREANRPKRDNRVDLIGFAIIADMVSSPED